MRRLFVKVIAGSAHGHNLKSPNGLDVRPTVARIKESIFNSIMPKLEGCFFLDLYSGSGAIGIEALSRGSQKTFFVEKNKMCVQIIKKNLELTKLNDRSKIICGDCRDILKKIWEQQILFDIIFMDPPYYKNLVSETLKILSRYKLLKDDGIIICETYSKEILPSITQFDFFKYKRYNTTTISYIKYKVIKGKI